MWYTFEQLNSQHSAVNVVSVCTIIIGVYIWKKAIVRSVLVMLVLTYALYTVPQRKLSSCRVSHQILTTIRFSCQLSSKLKVIQSWNLHQQKER